MRDLSKTGLTSTKATVLGDCRWHFVWFCPAGFSCPGPTCKLSRLPLKTVIMLKPFFLSSSLPALSHSLFEQSWETHLTVTSL